MKDPVICIDGPAASGKTTIAKALAERLGFLYLDTGVLYRAVTWLALQRGISPSNSEELAKLAREASIAVEAAPTGDLRQTVVVANGEDVSLAIRSPEVDADVSEVSAHAEVRTALNEVQRNMAAKGALILAGRDAGTVVWPEAEVKVFLVASEEERAKRRQRQAEEQGTHINFSTVLAELRRRDRYDSSRSVAPLRAAADATILDTTRMSIQQVVDKVLALIRQKTGVRAGRPRSL